MYVPKFSACRSPWIHTRLVRSSAQRSSSWSMTPIQRSLCVSSPAACRSIRGSVVERHVREGVRLGVDPEGCHVADLKLEDALAEGGSGGHHEVVGEALPHADEN